MKEAIILAGGLGTRLKDVIADRPKPLAPVSGKPFLAHLIDQLATYHIEKIILAIGYKGEMIKELFQKKNILISQEKTPLGTGGALKKALDLAEGENILVMNGDSYLDLNLEDMHAEHEKKKADLTIACKYVQEAFRYGSVSFDEECRIKAFKEKELSEKEAWINAGVYYLKKTLLSSFAASSFSLEKEAFPNLLNNRVFAYPACGKFIDIGTKESYLKADQFFE